MVKLCQQVSFRNAGVATIEYDLFNRMVKYTKGTDVYTYTYNGDGQRMSKTVNGITTNFVWDGMNMILEHVDYFNNTGYYYGPGGVEFQQYSDGMHLAAAYVKNALGDVVGTYDVMSGVTLYREYCYDAYGNAVEEYDNTNAIPPSENPFRYRGEYYDAETGLYYLRNRHYDPKAGRFITEDPIRDGTNWYVYCSNNPVNFFDLLGLEAVAIRDFVSQSAGGKTSWSNWTKTATFTIDGTKLTTNASGSDNNGGFAIWNENGRMMADDADLNNFFNIDGTVTVAAYYSEDEELYFEISGTSIQANIYSGHSYIEYTPLGGETDTYATHPEYEHLGTANGMHKNHSADRGLMSSANTAKYSKKITANQKEKMFNVINDPKNNTWSYTNNCTTFATKVFKAATKINLSGGYWPQTPLTLKQEINKRK